MKTNVSRTALQRLGHSLVAGVAAALLAGCADDAPLGPARRPAFPAQLAVGAPAEAEPELGACEHLRAPAGSSFAFHAYAKGVQIYRWDGASWVPVGPSATLYADAGGKSVVGTHYAGPKWESVSGSIVAGAVADRCVPDASAIPWLLLTAAPEGGPGVFQGVASIQRVNTVGGKAPAAGGSYSGEVKEVPYTAEYYFYHAP